MSEQFLPIVWGFSGSVAAELVTIYSYYHRGKNLPRRYSKIGFWFVRFLLALFGGALVVAYNIQQPLLAFHIGAATIVILQQFSQSPPTKKPQD